MIICSISTFRSSLSDADNAKVEEMLKRGMTMDEIIKRFMGGGLEGEAKLGARARHLACAVGLWRQPNTSMD